MQHTSIGIIFFSIYSSCFVSGTRKGDAPFRNTYSNSSASKSSNHSRAIHPKAVLIITLSVVTMNE